MNTQNTVKYFAREIRVDAYPHNGKKAWCVVNSLGFYHICRDEQSAKAEAMLNNAQAKKALPSSD